MEFAPALRAAAKLSRLPTGAIISKSLRFVVAKLRKTNEIERQEFYLTVNFLHFSNISPAPLTFAPNKYTSPPSLTPSRLRSVSAVITKLRTAMLACGICVLRRLICLEENGSTSSISKMRPGKSAAALFEVMRWVEEANCRTPKLSQREAKPRAFMRVTSG